MSIHRAHILFPEELIREIDEFVGARGRSAFLVESARKELRRQKLLRFLESSEPAWQDSAHPELANGAASYVRKIRHQNERGFPGKEDGGKHRK
jgi:metal-responsive CopG/Arc/MetJ family transcriptional regulator